MTRIAALTEAITTPSHQIFSRSGLTAIAIPYAVVITITVTKRACLKLNDFATKSAMAIIRTRKFQNSDACIGAFAT